ncbi:MAG: type III-A CRISPR-associated RAMP protein Csm4 [Acidimicrobiia bacterium]|nr:type III-A CRISPR-associated RAMP protein Csm4 [Acidimicrobiia bacterium]
MSDCLFVKLRPTAPWRLGPSNGARDRTDSICHSDTLYSALCHAMSRFDWLQAWLGATAEAENGCQVRLTSMFPWQGDLTYVPGPRNIWPPATARLRAGGADFVPSTLIASLLRGEGLEEDKWEVDGLSRCLIKAGRRGAYAGPFRHALRSSAAVDRLDAGAIGVHQTACIEFSQNAGLWCLAEFSTGEAGEQWSARLQSCFRLLADSGIGGERSRGWGHFEIEEMRAARLPDLLLGPPAAPTEEPPVEQAYWMLSLFSPASSDRIQWDKGTYSLIDRGGRLESAAGWGARKKRLRMVREGSVLLAEERPSGTAHNVAPDGFPHPVFRAGFAVAVAVPWSHQP